MGQKYPIGKLRGNPILKALSSKAFRGISQQNYPIPCRTCYPIRGALCSKGLRAILCQNYPIGRTEKRSAITKYPIKIASKVPESLVQQGLGCRIGVFHGIG